MEYIIYTDGSCIHHVGGWAAIIIDENKKEITISGNEYGTTNNRMELLAPIKALEYVNSKGSNNEIVLYSDSQYFVNAFNKHRISNYKPGRVNYDLWDKLKKLFVNNNIKLIWVRGHSNNRYNNLVDKISRREARKLKKNVGKGYVPVIRENFVESEAHTPEEEFKIEKERLENWGKKPPKPRKRKKRTIDSNTKVLLVMRRDQFGKEYPILVYDVEGTRYIDYFNKTSTYRKSLGEVIKENATIDDFKKFSCKK